LGLRELVLPMFEHLNCPNAASNRE
jgi:hypothetical protein